MKKILVNGCSHSLGTHLSLPNIKDRYDRLLAKYYNADISNLATSGGSNEKIFRQTVQEVTNVKYDLVILQWTDFDRFETPTKMENDHYHNRFSIDGWLQHKPSSILWPEREKLNIKWRDYYLANWNENINKKDFQVKMHKKNAALILALNAHISSLGIRCINLSWHPFKIRDSLYEPLKKLEWPIEHSYGFHNALFDYGYQYCMKSNGDKTGRDGHYEADGHYQLFQWIVDYLENGIMVTRNNTMKKEEAPAPLHIYEWD